MRSIGNGIADFFRLPYEGLTRGPGAFVSGVSRGTTSFVKHISKGSFFRFLVMRPDFHSFPVFLENVLNVLRELILPLALFGLLAGSETLDV